MQSLCSSEKSSIVIRVRALPEASHGGPPGLLNKDNRCALNSFFHVLSTPLSPYTLPPFHSKLPEDSASVAYMRDLVKYQQCSQPVYYLTDFHNWASKRQLRDRESGTFSFEKILQAFGIEWNQQMKGKDLNIGWSGAMQSPHIKVSSGKVILEKGASLEQDINSTFGIENESYQNLPRIMVYSPLYQGVQSGGTLSEKYSGRSLIFSASEKPYPYIVPRKLDMTPYFFVQNPFAQRKIYELVGIINHHNFSGEQIIGHATSYAKNSKGEWIHIDDAFSEKIRHPDPIVHITQERPGTSCHFVYQRAATSADLISDNIWLGGASATSAALACASIKLHRKLRRLSLRAFNRSLALTTGVAAVGFMTDFMNQPARHDQYHTPRMSIHKRAFESCCKGLRRFFAS